MDKDGKLMDPRFNDLIPSDNRLTAEDLEIINNSSIPEDYKPTHKIPDTSIFQQLQKSESAQVGIFLIQRRHRNGEGESGGEHFSLMNTETGEEVMGIELSELVKIKTEDDLKMILEGAAG